MSDQNNNQALDSGSIPVRVISGGGGGGGGTPPGSVPLGFQQLDLSTVKGFTLPTGATTAIVSVTGGDAVWRDDGVDPAPGVGMPIYAGPSVTFSGTLAPVRFIQSSAAATANVSYYR